MAKVLIYGAGAIGSFLGYLLSEVEGKEEGGKVVPIVESVALLGRMGHIQRIREKGLEVALLEGNRPPSIRFRHCFTDLNELGRSQFAPEIVVVCVKTHSLPAVLREIRESGLLEGKLKDADFVLLMNGMGNKEKFDLSANHVFEGTTSMGVVFSDDGKIELKGRGKTIFEAAMGKDSKKFIKARFEEKGFPVEFAEDFKLHQWMKLFANAVINPITALTGGKNGIVLSEHLKGVVEKIIAECVAVASKEGHQFDELEVLEFVRAVAEMTAANTSSMLQDVLNGKRTEIDSINGYVLDCAEKHGLEAPLNEMLYALVKSIEKGESKGLNRHER
ncbi:MAG TPA: 2-dehydropantoate 2-reductase [Methanotrichaceae archaeon]|nr:2-dehydropantoate 2-reductase [Methanotrichaceae archaeon]